MLAQILKARMNKSGQSGRTVAKEIGISNSTLSNVLKEQVVDLATMVKIAEWLDINPSSIINVHLDGEKSELSEKIDVLIEADPELKAMFTIMADEYTRGIITAEDIKEILNYVQFKVSSKH